VDASGAGNGRPASPADPSSLLPTCVAGALGSAADARTDTGAVP